jgi:outer membrane lipoprotein-sorting protein
MKKTILTAIAGLFLFGNASAQSAVDIVEKSMDAMKKVKSLSYHFVSQERFKGGKIEKADIQFKMTVTPLKVYADATLPEKAQLVYEPAVSKEVKVKKGIKLSLSPTNNLLMKQQHHPITRAGFGSVYRILDKSVKQRAGENYADFVSLLGSINYDGRDCWKILLNDPDYKIINYTVKNETTLWQIGEARAIPEYKIRELNGIDYGGLKPGQVIKIPSSYAKKTVLYIDKQTYLPLLQKMEDDLGMYEQYELKDLKLNPTLTEADFEFK